jgi:hypothetical protein
MLKIAFLFALLSTAFIKAPCQVITNESTMAFAEDLKKLVALNSLVEGVHNFAGPEAIKLSNATASQVVEITAPYHQSEILNAKGVCFYYLSHAVLKKEISQEQKQQLVEIICRYYLSTDEEVQTNNNVLLMLSEMDYNANAKKYIAALIDSLPKFSYGDCAQLMAIAQVKKNIPALWKIAKKDIEKMHRADIDVLASLARMGEKEAVILLCNYYSSDWNKRERQGLVIKSYVSFAKQLAFSLDRTVFDCLVADFKNFDLSFKENGGDYFWWPGQHLGKQIADMLTNYPYPKEYNLDPYKLLEWLNSTSKYELKEK